MTTTKKLFGAPPATLSITRNRIETLSRMANRYGRISVYDVQMLLDSTDITWPPLEAVTYGWNSTTFFIPVRLKGGWYVLMPDPKKF